ncbi:MAG: AAA family ATPase [Aeriscardovia sp.]|nr:AAA family ATPase [Aeriscardovia sp.]
MMSQDELKLFEKLVEDRKENARVIEKRSMRGASRDMADKYSDVAHFIYELLQNADDAKAEKARFILEPNKYLIFAHNGSRHFSVTDVDEDEKGKPLGDINAITAWGASTKENDQNKIGKYGVGIKSIYTYTRNPRIYDNKFKFRIERLVVPGLLEEDFTGRRADETLFMLPFDSPDKTPEQATKDISSKLQNLSYPLLFLPHLREIRYAIGNAEGIYQKKIEDSRQFEDITAELICCTNRFGDSENQNRLWLFTREDEEENKYSVGFFLEERDGKTCLCPVDMPAFCFFPTKEETDLHFIVQAPFLLTNSRESIKRYEPHNEKMIKLLADLAAESIVLLKQIGEDKENRLVDDHILSIIPYKKPYYSWSMWAPFYEDTKKIFETESVLPSRKGYTSKPHAYWAASSKMTDLFSNEQLEQLCGDPQAKWAFPSISRDTHGSLTQDERDIREFIDAVTHQHLSELDILDKITAPFIEAQSIEWLIDFYKWIDEDKDRRRKAKRLPIFLDQHGHAMSAFDEKGMEVLFLPSDVTTDDEYHYLAQSLWDKEELKNFFSSIGITTPSWGDYIYNKVIPLYKDTDANSNISIETSHKNFKLFFDYYCSHREEKFIDLLKECSFLTYCDPDGQWHRAKANELYLPTPELKEWFANSPSTHFVSEKKYVQIIGEQPNKDLLEDFLKDLGVKVDPQVSYCVRDPDTLEDANWKPSWSYNIWLEPQIDGLNKFIEGMPSCDLSELIDDNYYSNDEKDKIAKILQKNRSKAKLLWEEMKKLLEKATYYSFSGDWKIGTDSVFYGSKNRFPSGEHHWFYRRDQVELYASEVETQLRKLAWNYTKNEKFDPESVDDYDPSPKLLEIFAIKTPAKSPTEELMAELDQLPPKQKRKALAGALAMIENLKKQGEEGEEQVRENAEIANEDSPRDTLPSAESTENIAAPKGNEFSSPSSHKTTLLPSTVSTSSSSYSDENDEQEEDNSLDSDSIDKNIQKKQSEIESLNQLREKVTNASKLPKYSFGWFKALLSLEKEGLSSRKPEVSISFSKVEKDPDPASPRTIILRRPNRYIPQSIEDIPNIPLDLHMENGKTRSPEIEVVSVKGNTLRVKAKTEEQIKGIDFSKVTYATIDVKNPDFLLDTLTEQFANLDLPDDFNMQQNLCENIEFLVGPPGTGKTTYLAKEILRPLMEKEDSCKVLVLTPTNKAADVLVKKIMQVSGNDDSYNDWLARIGTTEDAEIEKAPFFEKRT